jgi:hypothetical protein
MTNVLVQLGLSNAIVNSRVACPSRPTPNRNPTRRLPGAPATPAGFGGDAGVAAKETAGVGALIHTRVGISGGRVTGQRIGFAHGTSRLSVVCRYTAYKHVVGTSMDSCGQGFCLAKRLTAGPSPTRRTNFVSSPRNLIQIAKRPDSCRSGTCGVGSVQEPPLDSKPRLQYPSYVASTRRRKRCTIHCLHAVTSIR